MKAIVQNLFSNLPEKLPDELFQSLVDDSCIRIERIVSQGHASPDGFWYDQTETEWVLLMTGAARLHFDDDSRITLRPGEAVLIPAHRKHRVEWTAPHELSIWVAVFWKAK